MKTNFGLLLSGRLRQVLLFRDQNRKCPFYFPPSFAIISLRKRVGCFTLIVFSTSCCCVAVSFLCLFLVVPWVDLWSWHFLVILTFSTTFQGTFENNGVFKWINIQYHIKKNYKEISENWTIITRLPNDPMLNIWKTTALWRRMSCNSLWIPTFVVWIWGQKVLSFCQIYFSRKIVLPEFDRNVFFARKVNMS